MSDFKLTDTDGLTAEQIRARLQLVEDAIERRNAPADVEPDPDALSAEELKICEQMTATKASAKSETAGAA
jgi:hypothetical protein